MSSTDSLRQRWVAIALVIGIHMLGGLALLSRHIVVVSQPSALVVNLLELPTTSTPSPPVAPTLQPLPLPTAIMPEVVTVQEATSTAISVLAIQAAVEKTSPVITQEPLIEALFDVDYLNNPQPAYPASSRRMREQGLVVLRVKVRVDGSVDTVLVQHRSGSIRLDEAALAAVRQWKFVPAKRGGQVIESWVLVPIEFELKA
jgi:periplasmic protein TonB